MPLSSRDLVGKTLAVILDATEKGTLDSVEAQLDVMLASQRPAPLAICKIDEERRMVYGWASVSTVGGELLVDRQNDTMTTDEMREMAHDFVGKRVLGEMHRDVEGIGELRDSIVLDQSLQEALGVDLGFEGWLVGFHVKRDSTWQRVKNGELVGFSIGGTGIREPIDEALKRVRGRTPLSRTLLFSEAFAALQGA